MDISKQLNRLDCTFYFIIDDDDKTKQLKTDAQKIICNKMAEHMGINFYGMRSGKEVRDTLELKNEFKDTIQEQINIIYINENEDKVILLSTEQRNKFFNEIMIATESKDTLSIVKSVLN